MLTEEERNAMSDKMLQVKHYMEHGDFHLAHPLLDELKQISDPDVQVMVSALEKVVIEEQSVATFYPRDFIVTIVAGAVIGGIIGVIQGQWLLFIIIGIVIAFFIDFQRWRKRIHAYYPDGKPPRKDIVTMSTSSKVIYQIKITLKRANPPIWRRVLITSDTTLEQLHMIIQDAMGWYNAHLHMFTINGQEYSTPMPYDPDHLAELGAKSTQRVKLNSLVRTEGAKFTYEYDFGDSWEHQILLEKILPYDPKQKLPQCIKGKRACPPEDIGGVWGYETFLEVIHDPEHPEHENYVEWYGDDFDPEYFNLDATNQRLG